jgi:hypothetical protein
LVFSPSLLSRSDELSVKADGWSYLSLRAEFAVGEFLRG